MIKRLCIIGLGSIGGSLARALRSAGACGEVVGVDRDPEQLHRAVELGVIDRQDTDAAKAVAGADMVVVAVPVGAMTAVFRAIAPAVSAGAVVTDVGSTKASVVMAANEAWRNIPENFVPGHPIAGTEKSGIEAANGELFQGRRVILTPLAQTRRTAVERVREMWVAAGAEVTEMEVVHHDEVLAATSHLPHLLAFNLVDTLANAEEQEEIFQYAAGGFRDFTRIASSDPVMWRDICLANRGPILDALAKFSTNLAELAKAIGQGDEEYILTVLRRAKAARDRFCG
jgi:prephenate dehydrogenase